MPGVAERQLKEGSKVFVGKARVLGHRAGGGASLFHAGNAAGIGCSLAGATQLGLLGRERDGGRRVIGGRVHVERVPGGIGRRLRVNLGECERDLLRGGGVDHRVCHGAIGGGKDAQRALANHDARAAGGVG